MPPLTPELLLTSIFGVLALLLLLWSTIRRAYRVVLVIAALLAAGAAGAAWVTSFWPMVALALLSLSLWFASVEVMDLSWRLRAALNIDIEPGDHDAMLRKVERYATAGVDGFIMKSPAAMRLVHGEFPAITIHASVSCNVRDRASMERVREAGATQFVASTALNTFERIEALKRTADEVGIGVELLIHSNRCITGVGGCRLYDYFAPYFEEQVVEDSDGSRRLKIIGNPDQGGVCYRPCLGNHVPEIAGRFPARVLTYLEKSNNEIYALLEDVPRYLALGFPIATGVIEELLFSLKKELTVVIVTHNMQQAARVSDCTAFMYLGQLVEFGLTKQLFTNPSKKQTEDYITGRFG